MCTPSAAVLHNAIGDGRYTPLYVRLLQLDCKQTQTQVLGAVMHVCHSLLAAFSCAAVTSVSSYAMLANLAARV